MLKITTNNQPRKLYSWYELPEKIQKKFASDFDYTSEDDWYFIYKGELYALCDFMRIDHQIHSELKEWCGIFNDSFFSGILIKFPNKEILDGEVIVGWFCEV